MRPLYQISNDILHCLSADDTGELPAGMEGRLDELEMDLAQKLEGCCAAVRNLEAEEKALRVEAGRFAERAQVAANAVQRLKDYMRGNLERLNLSSVDAGLFKVRLQKNSQPSVKFDGDPLKLPPVFQKVTVELAKAIVLACADQNMPIPEGVTVTRGNHLRIV